MHELSHVGVTGTNGKTSTTRFLAAGLGALARPVASITTVGAFLDEDVLEVPMTHGGMVEMIARARQQGGRYAVLEVTSEVLALGFARTWPFRTAVFTNLTHDHLDRHESPEHYFASKAQLFNALPAEGALAVVNGCDEASELLFEVTPANARRLAYGVPSRGAEVLPLAARAAKVDVTLEGTAAQVTLGAELGGGSVRLSTRAVGEIFLENALAAFVTCLALGAERGALLRRLAEASPPPGRFELVGTEPHVVVDYAHTPDALERTVATARAVARGDVTVVFGAGGDRDPNKRPAMGAAAAGADRVVLTSDNPRGEDPAVIARAIAEGIPAGVDVVTELEREEAIRRAILDAAPADLVVIAGKGHEATQTFGSVVRPFSDVDAARRALTARRRDRRDGA